VFRNSLKVGRNPNDFKDMEGPAYISFCLPDGESTEFVLSEVSSNLTKFKNQTKIFCPERRGDMFILKDYQAGRNIVDSIFLCRPASTRGAVRIMQNIYCSPQ